MNASSTTLLPCEEGTTGVSFALSDEYIAVTLTDQSIHVLSSLDGTSKYKFADPHGIAWSVALAADTVIVGSVDGSLVAYNISSKSLVASVQGPPSPTKGSIISLLAVLNQSNPLTVVSASEDGKLRLWDLDAQDCKFTLEDGHTSSVFKVHASPGKLLSASYDGSLCSWSLERGTLQWRRGFSVGIHALVPTAEKTLTVGFRDGQVKVLSREDGLADRDSYRSELTVFHAHKKVVNGLRLYEDLLISTGTDGWVKVWSVKDHQLLRQMKVHDKAIVSRSTIGPFVIAAGQNGGGDDNACGLDACVRSWRVDGNKSEYVLDISDPVTVVWNVSCTSDRVVASLMKRGKPAVQIWQASAIIGDA